MVDVDAADDRAAASARNDDPVGQRVATLADIARASATTTDSLVLAICGARSAAVETASRDSPRTANHNDQRLARRDRDGRAHLAAVSTGRIGALASPAYGINVQAGRACGHLEVPCMASELELSLTFARRVGHSKRRRNTLGPA
jgi:hypothetical protein